MMASLELDTAKRPDLKQKVLHILFNLGPDASKLSLFDNCVELLKLVWARRQDMLLIPAQRQSRPKMR